MSLSVIVLAAGKGTRMKSPLPKVLHLLAGEPLIIHVLETVFPLKPAQIAVVIGYKKERVKEILSSYAVEIAVQAEQLGTGHAVAITEQIFSNFEGDVLVLCGDTPLLRLDTIVSLVELHQRNNAVATVLTADFPEPRGYGRIVRDEMGMLAAIVEEKDASPAEKNIREINSGTYIFKKDFLFEALKQVKNDNAQGEYYLTDVIKIARTKGLPVAALKTNDFEEVLGVNSQFELARAEAIFQRRLREKFMANGVSFIFPDHVYIERQVKIAPGVVIYPFVSLRGKTFIEAEAIIESHCDLKDVRVLPGTRVKSGTILENAII
ncbi:bifunctional UDP-N-acetylglucosamine diphosphorylase/glucosamine-1-phosphate N-acetyltransferase GlmU [Thermodesulfatator indicus]